jgi:hypothetical protein
MMKKTLLKSMLGLLVLGMATSAHATSYTLLDNTFPGPSVNPGDVATFSNSFTTDTTFSDNWEFAVGPSSGLGGIVSNVVITVGPNTLEGISPFTVKLFAANGIGIPVGSSLSSGKSIDLPSLASGNYDLQINGTVTGSGVGGIDGAYSGILTATAVPLPAAAWLLLSGLAGVGAMARRRKSEQSA